MGAIRSGLNRSHWLILMLFSVLTIWIAGSHELGHDEVQAWNIARAADWPWDVIALGWYEGHTPLWHVLLWPLTRLGHPELMQALSVVLGIATACLLLRDRPFPSGVCVLILFGYFVFYEYTIIPRPYGLALFLSCVFASLVNRGAASFVTLSLLCGLIAFTSAFGTALSGALMLLILIEATQPATRITSVTLRHVLGGTTLYILIVLLAIWFIVFPVASNSFETQVISGERLHASALPQPVITASFPHIDRLPMGIGGWFSTTAGWWLTLSGAVLAAVGVFIWLFRTPAARLPWVAALVVLSASAAYVASLSDRHVGHLFMAALCLCWAAPGLTPARNWLTLSAFLRPPEGSQPTSSDDESSGLYYAYVRKTAAMGLVLVLSYQAVVGLGAAGMDIAREQSPWRSVARFIDSNIESGYVLTLDSGYLAGGVTAYLDQDVYDMSCDCWRRYTQWNTLQAIPDPQEIDRHVCELTRAGHDPLILISRADWWPDDRFELLATFEPGYRQPNKPDARLYRMAGDQLSGDVCSNGRDSLSSGS